MAALQHSSPLSDYSSTSARQGEAGASARRNAFILLLLFEQAEYAAGHPPAVTNHLLANFHSQLFRGATLLSGTAFRTFDYVVRLQGA